MRGGLPMHAVHHLALVAMMSPVFLSGCSTAPERPATGRFEARSLDVDGVAHRYQVFVPAPAAGGAHPPVILFLHGTGERGNDGDKPVRVGLGPHVRAHAADFPAIVVFAQAPDDRDCTYLTGLSMGGYGTWELALLQPQRFAALVPVCGALLPPSDERSLFVT